MSFLDLLVDASLDGAAFQYFDAESSIGRRTTVHEFPNRDEPFVEDLGRSARRFSIDAIVIEPDYFAKRNALNRVIERGGVHVLSHPYRGDIEVKIVGPVRIRESVRDGGMATFGLNFVEAGKPAELLEIAVFGDRVATAADRTNTELAANTALNKRTTIADVRNAASNAVNDASSALRKVKGKIAANLNAVESLSQSIDAFESEISTLLDTPQALVNRFVALGISIFNLANTAAGIVDAAPVNTIPLDFNRPEILRTSFRSMRDFSVDAEEPPDTTPQRRQEATDQDAVEQMVAVTGLSETSRNMALLTLDSADQAREIRDELADAFETQLNSTVTADPVYEALQDLRTEITNHLNQIAQDLPVVSIIVLPVDTPALVLAYSLYEDANEDLDIARRNNAKHPGFIPGGVDIEVLSSDA